MSHQLQRNIGLVSLTLFGVGDILGAGIYGLVGKAAGEMGNGIWMAFLFSALAALLTGLSYATLGSRFPRAGGSAYVLERAFGKPWLAYIVGLAVCASGLTSMAAASRVLAGYASSWAESIPQFAWVLFFIFAIGFVVFWGIKESLAFNAVCTIIEVSGLLFLIAVGLGALGSVNYLDVTSPSNPTGDLGFGLVFSGAVLTFYSFIGFEDILNVAEEVKEPETTLPRGLLLAVIISSLIYVLVSVIAVSVLTPAELFASKQPLLDIVAKRAPWFPTDIYRAIALFAVSNTLLLNFVMSTRLIYGMSTQGLLPKPLARIHATRKTPYVATILVLIVVSVLALSGDLSQLARSTAILLLVSFLLMNLALAKLQRNKREKRGAFEAPRFVPFAGAGICLVMLAHTKVTDWTVVGSILVIIVVLYFVQHHTVDRTLKKADRR